MRGEPVHGELITDGDSGNLTALKLFKAGQTTEHTLASDESLHICSVFISIEAGGDAVLVADSKADGRYIAYGNFAANGGIVRDYAFFPYVCPRGVTPKFSGAGEALSVCIIEGFITKV